VSIAMWMFLAIVIAPLVLLVIDLVSRKAPEPLAPPVPGAQRR
jgi:hypothetical protein